MVGYPGPVIRRMWVGRLVRLAVLVVAAFAGALIGLAPFVETEVREPALVDDGSALSAVEIPDCFFSPEAERVEARLERAVLALPLVAGLLAGGGVAAAARFRAARVPRLPGDGRDGAADDLILGALAVAVLAALALSFGHGFDIGSRLDPGCSLLPLPGPAITLTVGVAAVAGTWAVGFWLEWRSADRRRARRGQSSATTLRPGPGPTRPPAADRGR